VSATIRVSSVTRAALRRSNAAATGLMSQCSLPRCRLSRFSAPWTVADPRCVARATAVRCTCPPATKPVTISVRKVRRRESVNGLATPPANVHNRRRIAAGILPAMTPASFRGCNTNRRRRSRFPRQPELHWVNSRIPLA